METSVVTGGHMLLCPLVLYGHGSSDSNYDLSSYEEIMKIQTVEELIVLNETLSDIIIKYHMLFLMRDGIQPTYEDPMNIDGGRFSLKFADTNIVYCWKLLTYLFAGNQLSLHPEIAAKITGITISPKKKCCIAKIWMKTCEHQNPDLLNLKALEEFNSISSFFTKHEP